MDVTPVMRTKIQKVRWEADPQVNTRDPDQDCVLKALGEVRIFCVPCQIPILEGGKGGGKTQLRKSNHRTPVFKKKKKKEKGRKKRKNIAVLFCNSLHASLYLY